MYFHLYFCCRRRLISFEHFFALHLNRSSLPDNYKVILLQGGATGIFAATALNLIGQTGTADYIVTGDLQHSIQSVDLDLLLPEKYIIQITGGWSSKAAKEAAKYGKVNSVLPKVSKHTTVPDQSTWSLSPNAVSSAGPSDST